MVIIMNITGVLYVVQNNSVMLWKPQKVIKETDKCYFTESGRRYLKSEIGKPALFSPTEYSYVKLVMIDADEITLRTELSKWFSERAKEIREGII